MHKLVTKSTLLILLIISIFSLNFTGLIQVKADNAASNLTYYVDQLTGSDKWSGTSEDQAFSTLQPALNKASAGDTILVKNGLYYSKYTYSFKNNGAKNKYITLKNYPGQTPRLESDFWSVLNLSAKSYINVEGFEITNPSIIGDRIDGAGSGIVIEKKSHHINIKNNNIHNTGGAGIAAREADYVTITGNIVHDNAKQSDWANSGISFNDGYNSDTDSSTGYQVTITNNIVYGNEQTRLSAHCCDGVLSDGNGIIMDSNQHTGYKGKTLIANNLIINNGGRGINIYLSDNIDIINNTLFKNSRSSAINDGDLSINRSNNIQLYNNLIYSRDDKPCGRIYLSNNVTFDYNMCHSQSDSPFVSPHSVQEEARFLSPNSLLADRDGFELSAQTTSAINGGVVNYIVTDYLKNDLSGKARIFYDKVDIGALEYDSQFWFSYIQKHLQ